jgi:RNA recognition motif-containing protein
MTTGSGSSFSAGPTNIVYVGNLPFTTSEKDLYDLASSRGVKNIKSSRIATNKNSGKPRG